MNEEWMEPINGIKERMGRWWPGGATNSLSSLFRKDKKLSLAEGEKGVVAELLFPAPALLALHWFSINSIAQFTFIILIWFHQIKVFSSSTKSNNSFQWIQGKLVWVEWMGRIELLIVVGYGPWSSSAHELHFANFFNCLRSSCLLHLFINKEKTSPPLMKEIKEWKELKDWLELLDWRQNL